MLKIRKRRSTREPLLPGDSKKPRCALLALPPPPGVGKGQNRRANYPRDWRGGGAQRVADGTADPAPITPKGPASGQRLSCHPSLCIRTINGIFHNWWCCLSGHAKRHSLNKESTKIPARGHMHRDAIQCAGQFTPGFPRLAVHHFPALTPERHWCMLRSPVLTTLLRLSSMTQLVLPHGSNHLRP